VLTVLDQAYFEYVDDPDFADGVGELFKAGRRVVVLRTFSKIYGMAGLRCGLAIGRPDLLAKIQKFGSNFMPILAVAAATSSLQEPTLVAERRKINTDIRNQTFSWLTANNYEFIPSQTNCFMLNAGRPGKEVMAAMAQRNVYIGRVWPVMPNWVRITVGTRSEMDKFQQAWKEVMTGATTAFAAPMDAGRIARLGTRDLPPNVRRRMNAV
jgi:histidinol-phosphate aminotransferase